MVHPQADQLHRFRRPHRVEICVLKKEVGGNVLLVSSVINQFLPARCRGLAAMPSLGLLHIFARMSFGRVPRDQM